MTRVLQAMAGAAHGGAEAFFERLVAALARADVPQSAVIRSNPRRAAGLTTAGVPVVELPFGSPLDMATHYGFRREVARFQPEVVLTWMNRANRFCPRGKHVQVGRLGGYYDLKHYRHCHHLIGNTTDIVDYMLRKGWPADRAHYLPNFVAAEYSEPVSRKEWYIPPDAPVLLGLGRLHANKGFDVLIEAVSLVPNVYLVLAGDGPLRGELEKRAEHLGVKPRVRFLGWRDDVPALFAACDIMVCPSRHEPLGNVVIEAWAQGRPVVATAAQGPAALIANDETGLLVPVDDPRALAEAISRVLFVEGLGDHLAQEGHAAFVRDFTEEVVVERYRAFFAQVAP